ncbi:fumarylacetoacetate hydrolase family protein [Alicyclobacillus sp. ALC3]|uniref:fumarylacetoacetate hydrolase family protein n=1 Tax=Alicyclobacillus sp. ALC3 TaxID=2796143 RepID=UPI0023798078|nr:fumarylacetoacetate hydrolase family protein [Alicyclobacillus sp. ALC3]WDL97621.1 fumarylacetoacetate hydrolase family protein [Alicyclobacillus sp. ALC3]
MQFALGTCIVNQQPDVVIQTADGLFPLSQLVTVESLTNHVDVSTYLGSRDRSVLSMIERWDVMLPLCEELSAFFSEHCDDVAALDMSDTEMRWLPPILVPRKLICVGANYTDHLEEMGVSVRPTYPFSFLKPATTTLVGSGQAVRLPAIAKMVDWEGELAVVMGGHPLSLSDECIMAAVAAYSITNDVSARDWLHEPTPLGVDMTKMKGFDGFSPLGPFLTPAKFISDPQQLSIKTWVNGELKQDSNTRHMLFDIKAIIRHLSSIMTLEPGDVICTGTPAGVGAGAKPPQYLKPGDVVEIEIEGLGRLTTVFV